MKSKWTTDKIWDWYNEREWITGFNFIPSTTINGIELWQEYNHERVFADVGKELYLANALGYNSVRMVLPFSIWRVEPELFFKHVDEMLELLNKFGITMMPILFNDCLVPKERYRQIEFGKQPEPVKGYFGGSPVTCFDGQGNVGYSITDDEGMDEIVEEYIKQLANKYGQDDRILIWNVWNEAGNSNRGTMSLPMMTNVFNWLRKYDVSQPLTADVWGNMEEKKGNPCIELTNPRMDSEIELASIELSDIVSFHYYGDYMHVRKVIDDLKKYNRPLIIDEWLHRPMGSYIQSHLPLFKKENIGSYMFGFVNGKCQFNEVWEEIRDRKDLDVSLWMHDIFHSNFEPYDSEEIEVIKNCNLD